MHFRVNIGLTNGYSYYYFQVLLVYLVNRSHWITCKIDLKEWVIYIYDSLSHRTKNNTKKKVKYYKTRILTLIRDGSCWIFRVYRSTPKVGHVRSD